MAKRPNYGFQKRQKEIKRQRKKAEKAEKKRLKKEAAEEETSGTTEADDDLFETDEDTPTESRETID